MTGRRILFVHGALDRIAKPTSSRAVADNLSRTADVGYVTIADGKHAMLRHGSEFERLATDFAMTTLLGAKPGSVVGRALDGDAPITI